MPVRSFVGVLLAYIVWHVLVNRYGPRHPWMRTVIKLIGILGALLTTYLMGGWLFIALFFAAVAPLVWLDFRKTT